MRGFTALENVLLAMRFTGRRPDRNRARQLLDRVGLDHRITHRPAMLSVGEQQRVAVARAGQQAPAPAGRRADGERRRRAPAAGARPLAANCGEENVALVLVTHSPEVAGQFDRVEHLEEFDRSER